MADVFDPKTIKACARVADEWLKPGVLQLRAGEMTAQERRTVKAVVISIAAAIRALTPAQDPLDQVTFTLSGEKYEAFMRLLDNPPEPNAALRELMNRPAAWASSPPGWRDIASAPRDGTLILVADSRIGPDGFQQTVYWESPADRRDLDHPWATHDGINYHKKRFTDWQPLPAPPKPTDGVDQNG